MCLVSVFRMGCWTDTSSWHGSWSVLRRSDLAKMNFSGCCCRSCYRYTFGAWFIKPFHSANDNSIYVEHNLDLQYAVTLLTTAIHADRLTMPGCTNPMFGLYLRCWILLCACRSAILENSWKLWIFVHFDIFIYSLCLVNVTHFHSTRESLFSRPTCPGGWRTSAHGVSTCCWATGAWALAREDTQPTASWHSRGMPFPPLRPPSQREGSSPRLRSPTSTSALSTGLWCLDSAACYR